MPLADRCRNEFFSEYLSRGESIVDQGMVVARSKGHKAALAFVPDKGRTYEVTIDWSRAGAGELQADCQCRDYKRGDNCAHLWAAILEADRFGWTVTASGKRRLHIFEFGDPDDLDYDEDQYVDEDDEDEESYDEDYEDEDEYGDAPLPGMPIFSGAHLGLTRQPYLPPARSLGGFGPKSTTRKPDWHEPLLALQNYYVSSPAAGLSVAKEREIFYLLDPVRMAVSNQFTISFVRRERKMNGEFGKFKSLRVDPPNIDKEFQGEDRELLRLLTRLGTSEYGATYWYQPRVDQATLDPSLFEYVLPRLCATGRFCLSLVDESDEVALRPLAWDDGPPWRFRVRVAAEPKSGQWIISGEYYRDDGQQVIRPVMVHEAGIILIDDHFARFDAGRHFGWAAILHHNELHVAEKERRDFLSKLVEAGELPAIRWPEETAVAFEHAAPQGKLQIDAPVANQPQRLWARISFLYGDRTFQVGQRAAGAVEPGELKVSLRDRSREAELLRQLTEAGLRLEIGMPSGDAWFPHKTLPQVVERLVAAGWMVEAEGHLLRKAGEFRISVTSGIDWFELDGALEFDGQSVAFPAVIAALRDGNRYVRLDDGTHGLLPEEWLAQFKRLAEWGQAEGDILRFRPSQAMLLDAMLAGQEQVKFDERFEQARDRLRSLHGVAPRSAPDGFQGALRQYQQEGLGWLDFLTEYGFGGCLADDMGLGKTVQVLALLEARRTREPTDGRRPPSLVVVPRSLVFNWIAEASRFTPQLRVLNFTGLGRKEHIEKLDDFDLVITTYGTLRRDVARLKDYRFDMAILDEAQAIKNSQAQVAKACRLLQADHHLAMTGTPVENHLGELWSLFEFLNPGMLGSSRTFQAATKANGEGNGQVEVLARGLAPFILRRTKQQVLKELPKKLEQTLYCELEGKERHRYDELRDFYRASLQKRIEEKGLEKTKIHVLEALLRLRQAACHTGLLDKKLADGPSAKLELLLEQLTEVVDEGHKALVFSQFVSLLTIVRRRLDERGLTYEYLDGRTRDRQSRVTRFQEDPECPLFLISLKAGGQGLNLTAADYVFILDPWWNPAVEAQAIDRAHRIGQTRQVFAYRLIARDTVEEKILELQQRKRRLADAIVSADASLLRNLTVEDLQLLLS